MHFPDYSLLYLHAPKTAGNAIQTALIDFSEDQKKQSGHQDGLQTFKVIGPKTKGKHSTLEDYRETLGADLPSYRVCLSIRHPFDRALSFYFSPHRWFRQASNGAYEATQPHWSTTDFEVCLSQMTHMSAFVTVDAIFRMPDFLIRYENLENDFQKFISEAGIPASSARLPVMNSSADQTGVKERLRSDKGLARIVSNEFADDMNAFAYN